MGYMLEIKDIYKTFNAGTVNEKRALNGLSLNLEDGDFVTVIGGNGAGKSTLMNAISGVVKREKGTFTLEGQPLPAQALDDLQHLDLISKVQV